MARSDLLVSLVQASASGDSKELATTELDDDCRRAGQAR